jgi:hypothetical protein
MNTSSFLWSDTSRTRFFLIPDDRQLAPGDFRIRTITGRKLDVDPATLSPFELTEEQAKQWLESQFGTMLDSARNAVEGFVNRLAGTDADRSATLSAAIENLERAIDRYTASATPLVPADVVVLEEFANRLEKLRDRIDTVILNAPQGDTHKYPQGSEKPNCHKP